jgi:hypothetical protein
MKKTLYILLLTLSTVGFLQVKDISFTASPYWLYFLWQTIWIRKCKSIGGKIGFGFSEYVETVRFIYNR